MRIAALLVLLLASGCSTGLDLDRARELLRREPAPRIPRLVDQPPARLDPTPGLVATSGELRAIPLRWDPLLTGEVAGYAVERSPADAEDFERVAVLAGRFETAWVDRGGAAEDAAAGDLPDGSRWRYRVRAFDSLGRLAPPEEAEVEARTAVPPAPPPGLRSYSQLPRRVALRWEPAPDPTVTGYVVERSPVARGGFLPIARVPGRFHVTYVDRGLGNLRVFYYRVAAVNSGGGTGDATEPVRAVTKPEPLPPTGLRVVRRRLGSNVIRWKPNAEGDIALYQLLRRREGSEHTEVVATVDGLTTRAEDTEVGAGERVYYSVVATDADGLESDRSQEIQVGSRGYSLRGKVRGGELHLRWSSKVQRHLSEVRVLRLGTLGPREIARVRESRFVAKAGAPGSRQRFQLVGIRKDGSQAPASQVLELEIPRARAAR